MSSALSEFRAVAVSVLSKAVSRREKRQVDEEAEYLRRLFRRVERAVDVDRAFRRASMQKDARVAYREALEEALSRLYYRATTFASRSTRLRPEGWDPEADAERIIRGNREMFQKMLDTFERRFVEIVRRAREEAEGNPNKFRRVFRQMLRDELDYRAGLIAETEWTRARHEASTEIARREKVMFGRFMTAADGRVCPMCEALHGKGGVLEDLPRPPLHAGCRCAVVPDRWFGIEEFAGVL